MNDLTDEDIFSRCGMSKKNVRNLIKNKEKSLLVRQILEESIDFKSSNNPLEKKIGSLMLEMALNKKISHVKSSYRKLIGNSILTKEITRKIQIEEGIKFFIAISSSSFDEGKEEDMKKFRKSCGIGVEIADELVSKLTLKYFNGIDNDEILCTPSLGKFVTQLKNENPILKWYDGRKLVKGIEKVIVEKLNVKDFKELKRKQRKLTKQKNVLLSLRFDARELEIAKNTKEILEKHKKMTGGKVITRFPPEPNGYLHIGHAKAMLIDFGYAEQKGGGCNLRFDDTNPEKESQEYIDGILEVVNWLGFKPAKVCHASDYFDQLYEYAVIMIKKGLAYCDFSTQEEMSKQRKERTPSPFREKCSNEENLKIFEGMKNGKYDEGEVSLRCKGDYESDNANMRDFVAYRIKLHAHPRTKDKWCIYPTYEFTHCISDSIENVTHSMCTMEFESKREPYFWILDKLELFKPYVWEFSRLNITRALLSKRKINALLEKNILKGFDDPRLLTCFGLRRRGYSAEIIKSFCMDSGGGRSTSSFVNIAKLEQTCRIILDKECNRVFCVVNPLKIVLTNMDENDIKHYDAKNHPGNKSRGMRKLPLNKIVYIERDDFMVVDDENFFGLAPNKWVGLRYGPNIKCEEVIMGENSKVEELRCLVDFEKKEETKGHIHWISSPKYGVEPMTVELRKYSYLLKVDVLKKGMELDDVVDVNSEKVIKGCMIEEMFREEEMRREYNRYQFERIGFMVVDKDTTKENLVFNFIVSIKESKFKKSLKEKGKKKGGKKKGGKKKN